MSVAKAFITAFLVAAINEGAVILTGCPKWAAMAVFLITFRVVFQARLRREPNE